MKGTRALEMPRPFDTETQEVPMPKYSNTLATITARITVTEDGCHVWTGTTDGKGYGRVHYQHHYWIAHRLFYSLHVGPIPAGFDVHHVCRNTLCCNPDHLMAVHPHEHPDNPAVINAAKTHCKRGHEFTPENTKDVGDGGRMCRQCGVDYQRQYHLDRREQRLARARQRWREANPVPQRKTHCKHGHEYTPENTYICPKGNRSCLICRGAAEARRRAKR